MSSSGKPRSKKRKGPMRRQSRSLTNLQTHANAATLSRASSEAFRIDRNPSNPQPEPGNATDLQASTHFLDNAESRAVSPLDADVITSNAVEAVEAALEESHFLVENRNRSSVDETKSDPVATEITELRERVLNTQEKHTQTHLLEKLMLRVDFNQDPKNAREIPGKIDLDPSVHGDDTNSISSAINPESDGTFTMPGMSSLLKSAFSPQKLGNFSRFGGKTQPTSLTPIAVYENDTNRMDNNPFKNLVPVLQVPTHPHHSSREITMISNPVELHSISDQLVPVNIDVNLTTADANAIAIGTVTSSIHGTEREDEEESDFSDESDECEDCYDYPAQFCHIKQDDTDSLFDDENDAVSGSSSGYLADDELSPSSSTTSSNSGEGNGNNDFMNRLILARAQGNSGSDYVENYEIEPSSSSSTSNNPPPVPAPVNAPNAPRATKTKTKTTISQSSTKK